MIVDWDDAYANGKHIPGGDAYPGPWLAPAAAYREAMTAKGRAELDLPYGEAPRERLDLFLPEGAPKGLFVFVHGGFWMRLDKSVWSHLAAGAIARGWAVAMPSYTLAPDARIAEITRQIGRAIAFAAGRIAGPVRLAGHSAGGHLVTRMICRDSPLEPALQGRLEQVVSISGLHDLRPLMKTAMNATLRLDAGEATSESPALNWPLPVPLVCWVGSAERPEFVRQNDLLANIWTGLGASTLSVHAPGLHHFNVIDDLADAGSELAGLVAP